MNDSGFAEQIRKVAEEQQDLIRKAREEERRATEERHKEKARRKVECSTVCQRVLLPTMKLFAMGLEAAKVFPTECWKVDYEPADDDQYCCLCWARLPKTEPSAKPVGVVVKSTLTPVVADANLVQVHVQVKCCQATPSDWKEVATLAGSEPSEGVAPVFVDELYNLNSASLDNWHKQRLEDCAKACACWLEQHASTATLNRLEMEVLNLQRLAAGQSCVAK
jgi:hypothetical protein